MVCVDVVQTRQDLVKNTLDVLAFKVFVVTGLHQLIQVAIHVFHADVKLVGEGVEKDVEGRDEVGVNG